MDDAELKAMEANLKALSGLQPEEQKRVLIWLSERLNLPRYCSQLDKRSSHQPTSAHAWFIEA
jgi:hypothetical protein